MGLDTRKRTPILMYHAVHPKNSLLSIPPEIFKRQMIWLAEQRYRVIRFIDLLTCIKLGKDLPERSIVLTFDDGLECLYTYAYPILREYGFEATIFLVSGFVGETNQWPGQPKFVPLLPLLSWEQIREMKCDGIDFGAHSITHSRLDKLKLEEAEHEVLGSKEFIENELGEKINSFAYPYGIKNRTIYEIVKKAFEGACSTNIGYATADSDPWMCERIDIHYFRSEFLFKNIMTSLGRLYLTLRKPLRRLRTSFYRS